jgi:hypothetical protein
MATATRIAREHNLALRDPKRPERGWRLIAACGTRKMRGGRERH